MTGKVNDTRKTELSILITKAVVDYVEVRRGTMRVAVSLYCGENELATAHLSSTYPKDSSGYIDLDERGLELIEELFLYVKRRANLSLERIQKTLPGKPTEYEVE